MLKLLSAFFFLVFTANCVHSQTYTRIVALPLPTNLQEQIVNPQSVIYVSTPPPRPVRYRKTSKRRPRPVVEQYLKEVTPTTKTLFNEKQLVSTTERDDRIITREDPLYYGQRHTSVALPAVVVPMEYYTDVRPRDGYESVRSSNRKTHPYLPTSVRFQNIDAVRELLLYRQDVENRDEKEKQKSRSQRARCEEDGVSHVVGYFSLSHEGIVPKNREEKAKK